MSALLFLVALCCGFLGKSWGWAFIIMVIVWMRDKR